MALAREMAPLRRHELLRQARLLTGPCLEGDDHAAFLWARFLRGAGRPEAAAEEERLARELTRSSANFGRINGAAYRALFVLVLPVLIAVHQVLSARTFFGGPLGMQDSLGHPAVAEALANWASPPSGRHASSSAR